MTADVVPFPVPANDVPDFQAIAQNSSHSFRYPFVFDGTETNGAKIQWTVKNLLISGGLSVVYGPPKSGKSFLAQDIAERVAHGLDFFGRKTRQGLVVYICAEGAIGFRQRMIAWRHVNDTKPTRNFVMLPAAIDIVNGVDAVAALIADLKALSREMGQPIAMVVIDTLARSFGAADENSACDMGKFINGVALLQDALERELGLKPHVLVVHHTGKRVADGMRGSNSLLGAVDCAIEVTVDPDKIRHVRVPDIKDAAAPDPFYYRLRSVQVGEDEDGEPEYSCAVEKATVAIRTTEEDEDAAPKRRRRRSAK